MLCLGLFTAARVAEQVRAGIQSLPRGQKMAGLAMGFTLAAVAWAAAFAIYVWIYTPWLMRTRVDGKDG